MRLHRSMRGALLLLVCAVSDTWATPITFEGAVGNLRASASFEVVGSQLLITLTNSSTNDVLLPSEVLTAVFFDIEGQPVLTPISAVVAPGSVVWFGPTGPGGSVGGEWAYRSGLAGAAGGGRYGISSAGFGLFGSGDRFPGDNLQGPDSPNGLQYGITSGGDNPATGNAPVTGDHALIRNAVVFSLGLPAGFGPDLSVGNVWMQYGTALNDPQFPADPAPEPGTWTLLIGGFGAILLSRRGLVRSARR